MRYIVSPESTFGEVGRGGTAAPAQPRSTAPQMQRTASGDRFWNGEMLDDVLGLLEQGEALPFP